jgi:hypothetical protein
MKTIYGRILILIGLSVLVLFCVGCSAGSSTNILEGVITIVGGLLPIATGVLSDLLPADQAAVASASTETGNILTALQSVIKTYQDHPGTSTLSDVTQGFAAADANLQAILTAAAVKNSKTAAKITNVVNGVQATVSMLEAGIMAAHPAAVAAAS